MARPKYKINKQDYFTAFIFLNNKVKNRYRFDGANKDNGNDEVRNIVLLSEEFKSISLTYSIESQDKLNEWCESWLSSSDWTRLKISIRAKRKRIRDKSNAESSVSINLSRKAHSLLSIRAKNENINLSEVIEKYIPILALD